MKANLQRKWLGGYVRHGKKGPAFIIERWIDGRRYHVSTKCRTERAALHQLEEFEADPQSYRPMRAGREKVVPSSTAMTAQLVEGYREWLLSRDKPTTQEHADKMESTLRRWMVFLRGREIRSVKLSELSAHLETVRGKSMRVAALKGFCKWLRRVKFLLERAEDPTIDLQMPARKAAKDARQVAIEPDRIMAVLPHLPEVARDILILRLGTGWHSTEVARFASGGEIRRTPGKFVHLMGGAGPARVPLLAVLAVRQKVGVTTNTPILYAEHLAAAERIQARGSIPKRDALNTLLKRACKAAGVKRFWNWHIRHSVVSNAVESGADLEQASVFVDHFGIDTTRRHYLQLALPKKAVPVLRVLDGGTKTG